MKLKKAVKVLLSCVLAGALFTGCGGNQGGSKPGEDPNKEVSLGMITRLNVTEAKMAEILANVEEHTGVKVTSYKPKFYDNLSLLQMGLESKSVDQISVYTCVADYMTATNDKLELVKEHSLSKLSDQFCFAVRKEDTQLRDDLNKAIDEMKADKTLDKLVNDYITNVKKDNIPLVEIPKFEGAETIKVGVTGDLPPLDYVSPDGTPAGFNTAMLAEIAKRLNKNIELVQIDSGARATALTSKKIDVVFWAVIPNGDELPKDIDKPEGLEFSHPYFKEDVAHVQLKK